MDQRLIDGLSELLEMPLAPETRLDDGTVTWDSFAVVGVLALVDDLYSVVLSGPDLAKCATVQAIEELVIKARAS